MESTRKLCFSSENFSGVQEEIMQALIESNRHQVASYGNDPFTHAAIALLKEHFGQDIEVYFTFNGTGANNFGLSCVTEKVSSIFCTDMAHLNVDESTAPECFIGCRIYPVNSLNGKIRIDDLKTKIRRVGDIHHPQPGIVSITQPTELGTVYRLEEMKAIKAVCREHGLLLHVDGARFFNAAACLDLSLKELCGEGGIDILTLGGTKIGMMFGEAVLFFNPADKRAFKFNLKRSMQLASKNRFIAVQFSRLFRDGLWQRIAKYTNQLARVLEQEIRKIPSLKIAYPVESNAVFVNMPKELHQKMQEFATFYYWNEERSEARFIGSFDNTVEEVKQLADKIRECLEEG